MTSPPESASSSQGWTSVMEPTSRWADLRLAEVWRYRDLLWMFVRRDFVATYKQTVLGPLWLILQPLLTTLVFTLIFSGVARIPTDGHPPLLFYLAGTTPWNYFAACLTKTSNTFVANANIFGKVYFPRLVTPLSVIISNLIQFAIQLALFFAMMLYYVAKGHSFGVDWLNVAILTPLLLALLACLGLGAGLIVSSLTTKYRDFAFLTGFGVQLAMYATPVIYPMSALPEKWRWLIELNPMSAPIEAFRATFLGGGLPWGGLIQSFLVTALVCLVGLLAFNRVEKSFMDTV